MSNTLSVSSIADSFRPDLQTTIVVICYNSAQYVRACVRSVQTAVGDATSILIIDNGSEDDTPTIVRAEFPDCELIALPQNIGHSAACNLALQHATTTWVLLLDHDTYVPFGWLKPLLQLAVAYPDSGMISSRAVLVQQQRIHHDGGFAHFVGHMTLYHGFVPLTEMPKTAESYEVGAQASTSLLIHRSRALEAGGFDPRFFIYLNDFDLSLRMRLRGWRCYVAPQSVVYHLQGNQQTSWRGSGAYPLRRAYLIYRNRWMLMLKVYARRTLLLCAPAILLYECILFAAAVRKGWLPAYGRALYDVWRQWPTLMTQRQRIQATRCISDRALLSAHGLSFVPGLVQRRGALHAKRIIERFLAVYWWLVAPLLG